MDVPECGRICRFCLRSSEVLVNVCRDVELVFKILSCLSLEVDPDDGLPSTICKECFMLTEKLCAFRDQCARAELLLRASVVSRVPLLENFERVKFDSEKRAVGVDVAVQVEELIKEESDDVIFVEQIKSEPEDEGWHMADEPDLEMLDDLRRDLYGEEEGITNVGEDAQPEEEVQISISNAIQCNEEDKIQESTISNSEILDVSDESRPVSSLSDSSLDTCSFVSNNEDLRKQMEEILLADEPEVSQPCVQEKSRDLGPELDTDSPRSPSSEPEEPEVSQVESNVDSPRCPTPVETYDLTSSPEPDLPTEVDTSSPKTPQPSFPEAMRLLSESIEDRDKSLSSSKHNWSMILDRNKQTPTRLQLPPVEDPLESELRLINEGIPLTPGSPDMDNIFGDCDPVSDEDNNNANEEELDIYEGCEPISDEDTAATAEQRQLSTPDNKIVQPDPVTPEEIFDCELCDKFYPRKCLLELHKRVYHTSPHSRKMSIVIDNPTRRCPKCGEMVHRASFWAHKKAHNAAEQQLINYDREEMVV